MLINIFAARRSMRRAARCARNTYRCEVCKTERYPDAYRQCDFCGARGCNRCVERWHDYEVCRNCLGR